MKKMTKWLALLTLVLAGGVVSPFAVRAQDVVEGEAEVEQTEDKNTNEIRIRVRNHNMRELHVYVVAGPIGSPLTSRVSLGMVYAQGNKLFKLRDSIVARGGGQFRILVRPVGSHQFLASEHIIVGKGGTVEWTLVRPLRSGGYISITE